MKTMTCKQLWGACDEEFQANTFEEIAEISKEHWMKMFQEWDIAHLDAMGKMNELMKSPEKMNEWFQAKKVEFEELSDD